MKRYVLIAIAFTVFFASRCSSDSSRTVENVIQDKKNEKVLSQVIRPINPRTDDTISNYTIYKTRLYFNSDSLIRIARNNNVEEYLKVEFAYRKADDTVVEKNALLRGDTAYVDIDVQVPELDTNEVFEFNWMYRFKVRLKRESITNDTTFTVIDKFYVRKY